MAEEKFVAVGTPEEVAEIPSSYTGKYLKQVLNRVYPEFRK